MSAGVSKTLPSAPPKSLSHQARDFLWAMRPRPMWAELVVWGLAAAVCIGMVLWIWPRPVDPRTVRCSDFRTQPSAQVRFDSDPIAYRHLDGDFDSRACESLPLR